MFRATCALLFLACCPYAAFSAQPPNVIVVMTDDQGYGEFSCHGNPIVETPNIDQLAAESVRLTDFHVAPMCTPTRGQLMTGLDAFRNGAINVSSGRSLLRAELKTMADVFRDAGYRTGIFGKWHLGDNFPYRPEDRGFDEAIWFPSSHINSVADHWDNDYFDDTYIRNGKRQRYTGYCTDVFFREAMNWISSRDATAQPFFAYIALNAAHWPWFVPEHYCDPIRQTMLEHEYIVAHLSASKREQLVRFLAMGANIDENMGRLDELLTTLRIRENTILVFLTDNGSTMGPAYFNARMRGNKTSLWEGGHRVPCFIRWPQGKLGPPREIAELTHVQDLMPTLAELAGARKHLPDNLDGESWVPLFSGQRHALEKRMLVINYSRMPTFAVNYTQENPAIPQRAGAAVLWKHWRLLEDRELYDLRSDPEQRHDVAAKYPDVVAKMREHLDVWWSGVKDRVAEPQRIVIGDSRENPLMLTACDWLDTFVDQQRQVRRGTAKNGVWHLAVAQRGTYEFELRRWPRESGLRLADGCSETRVVDGRYVAGRALPITQGRLRIGAVDKRSPAADDGESIRFSAVLPAGPLEMQTWMLDSLGRELVGAYYVYVRRLE